MRSNLVISALSRDSYSRKREATYVSYALTRAAGAKAPLICVGQVCLGKVSTRNQAKYANYHREQEFMLARLRRPLISAAITKPYKLLIIRTMADIPNRSPVPSLKLNDGNSIPMLGYGTGKQPFKNILFVTPTSSL